MPPRKAPDPQLLERLAEAVEEASGNVEDLTDLLEDIRSQLQAVTGKPDRLPPPVMHITSLPKDPLDPEFGTKINAVPPEEVARLRDQAVPPLPSGSPKRGKKQDRKSLFG